MATVGAARDTTRVNLGGSIEGLGEATNLDLRAATSKGQSGTDTQRSLRGNGRVEVELDGDGAVDRLEESHGEVTDLARADGVGDGTPAGHTVIAGVHAELVLGVEEAGGLAVPVANLEDSGALAGEDGGGGGDGGAGGAAGRDLDLLGGDLELALVEDHGVGARGHVGRGEGAAGSLGPVLEVIVVPVYDGLETGRGAGGLATDPTSCRVGSVARDGEVAEEAEVNVLLLRDAAAGEHESVRAVEALAVGLGLSVVRVHVEGEGAESAVVVGVDVTEEGAAGALLVRARSVSDNAGVNILGAALEAVDVIVDESLRRVELGASLPVDDKDVRSLDSRAGATSGGGITKGVLEGKLGAVESGKVSELSNSRLGLGVGGHVDGIGTLGNDIVVSQVKVTVAGNTGDLDVLAWKFCLLATNEHV